MYSHINIHICMWGVSEIVFSLEINWEYLDICIMDYLNSVIIFCLSIYCRLLSIDIFYIKKTIIKINFSLKSAMNECLIADSLISCAC